MAAYSVTRFDAIDEIDDGGVPYRPDAPAGTLVFAEPGVKRTAFAEEDGTTVVVVGGKPGKVYEVLGFEAWAPFNPLYEAGDYAEAADQARAVIEANPEALGAFFCLACCEARASRDDDAARHLRHALEGSERLRGIGRRTSDLDSVRDRLEIAELFAE